MIDSALDALPLTEMQELRSGEEVPEVAIKSLDGFANLQRLADAMIPGRVPPGPPAGLDPLKFRLDQHSHGREQKMSNPLTKSHTITALAGITDPADIVERLEEIGIRFEEEPPRSTGEAMARKIVTEGHSEKSIAINFDNERIPFFITGGRPRESDIEFARHLIADAIDAALAENAAAVDWTTVGEDLIEDLGSYLEDGGSTSKWIRDFFTAKAKQSPAPAVSVATKEGSGEAVADAFFGNPEIRLFLSSGRLEAARARLVRLIGEVLESPAPANPVEPTDPDKPLPCPFCGEPAYITRGHGSECYSVRCTTGQANAPNFSKCGVKPTSHHFATTRDAIAAWNKRSFVLPPLDISDLLQKIRNAKHGSTDGRFDGGIERACDVVSAYFTGVPSIPSFDWAVMLRASDVVLRSKVEGVAPPAPKSEYWVAKIGELKAPEDFSDDYFYGYLACRADALRVLEAK